MCSATSIPNLTLILGKSISDNDSKLPLGRLQDCKCVPGDKFKSIFRCLSNLMFYMVICKWFYIVKFCFIKWSLERNRLRSMGCRLLYEAAGENRSQSCHACYMRKIEIRNSWPNVARHNCHFSTNESDSTHHYLCILFFVWNFFFKNSCFLNKSTK